MSQQRILKLRTATGESVVDMGEIQMTEIESEEEERVIEWERGGRERERE